MKIATQYTNFVEVLNGEDESEQNVANEIIANFMPHIDMTTVGYLGDIEAFFILFKDKSVVVIFNKSTGQNLLTLMI